MKKITMKITGAQSAEGQQDDQMEFITEGELYDKGGALYVMYEESEISGMPGFKTRLKITDQMVKMKRIAPSGGTGTEMVFEKGKRYNNFYHTPYGPFEMEIVTNDLENTMTAEGAGAVYIDYSMSLKGLVDSHNTLRIELL